MEELLILLIVIQAVFMVISYYALARQIRSTRKRLATLGESAAIIPIFGIIVAILSNGINAEELAVVFNFYAYGVATNGIMGVIVEIIDYNLLGGR
ncbi:MAG: hypothetical protein ABIF85_07445 [Nanoarchaeota archaeon]